MQARKMKIISLSAYSFFQIIISILEQGFGVTVVLFHCTAGKDRTGFASSLLLHILDVSEEIMKDYL
jgi:protein tyrosine/serine phosphatase